MDSCLTESAARTAPAYTLEIACKDIARVEAARAAIPPGTPINIAFLGNEDHAQRINAARVTRACGFEPVPVLSARRLRSEQDRDGLVAALAAAAAPRRFLLVGGDPASPAGPYRDSLALLQGGLLSRHAIRNVGIAGHPEGHPRTTRDELWRALAWKLDFLQAAGCSVEITTQFCLDADAVLDWIARLRRQGIAVPVRIGVPGPAEAGRLLRFARQFGVGASAEVAGRYGLPLDDLPRRAGPERFFDRLAAGMAARDLGCVRYHIYAFGGLAEAVEWMNRRLSESPAGA